MATPSSSATSASPPMAYLQANTIPATAGATGMDPVEREQRKKAVQKFLARAEVSMVTRALRARLSYASYKATHNLSHIQLRDLEAQTQSQPVSSSRTTTAKRKSGGGNNYYNNPATQGNGSTSVSSPRRGSMAPPPVSASASRSHYPGVNGNTNRSANAAQSLYTSILAPPSAKQARTIHNVGDPPLAAPSRPGATPRSRRGSKSSETRSALSIAESTRAQAKIRREEKSQEKRKEKRSAKGKEKERSTVQSVVGSGEDDMKAAATLTSLLLQSRPSMTGSASSPRSSISTGSDPGSVLSYAHFAQSSTRTTTGSTTAPTSAETSFLIQQTQRSSTPPPLSGSTAADIGNTTPKNTGPHRPHAPTDSEAADLMLFLATSPSPARPTTNRDKDSQDMAAYRALGGGPGLRAKGRVLFPGADNGNDTGRALNRGGDSFASSMSSIGGEVGGGSLDGPTNSQNRISEASMDLPSKVVALTPSQLLPPPPSPPTKHNADPSCPPLTSNRWPGYLPTDLKSTLQAPPTPGSVPFNFNDFINVSPSPAAAPPRSHSVNGQIKSGLSSSLRADVGRKLFEEEQHRHQTLVQGHGDVNEMGKMQEFGEELGGESTERGSSLGLGAGIDLVQG